MEIKAKVYTRTNDSGTQYARIILPKELRAFVSKAAVWRSLSTKDIVEAKEAGIVTALASRTVFQEAADRFLESATVVVATEIVGEKIDLNAVVNIINGEETERVAESLRQSFGLTSSEPPVGNSTDSSGSPNASASGNTRTVKVSKKKSVAGQASSKIQIEPAPQSNDNIVEYIELRPHGVFRFRYWIPRPLQKVIGQREVRVTLGTKDREVAIKKARPMYWELRQKLQSLKGASLSA